MDLRNVIVGVSFVLVASAGIAHADETKSLARALQAPNESTPWFERFTASVGEPSKNASTAAPVEQSVTGMVSAKWGFSLNLRDADRTKTATRDEAAVGAFYDFTPRLRVGGEVRMADPVATSAPTGRGVAREPSAGVKLESAFRF